jgi:non-specific protein-tyrosine kinase
VDAQDYARVLRRRWRVVALGTAIGVLLAIAATLLATPIYAARIKLFVSAQEAGGDSGSNPYQLGLLSQQRVTSYADLVSGPVVAEGVVEDLRLGESPAAVQQYISASAPINTVLINVTVTHRSPARAKEIADAVGARFSKLVAQLETPAKGGSPLVKVTVVESARTPTAPVSPRRRLNLALGLLFGLGIGVAGAMLRENLDTSVKGTEDVADLVDRPTLGIIGYDTDATRRPLIVQADPHSQRAEAFRQLRTNLQFVDIDNSPRSIVVTSSIPAEGKSTTCANLAISLAQAGLKVVLVEGDLRRPQISDYMGIESAVGLTSVLIGRVALEDAIQPWGGDGLLFMLPCGPIPPNPAELLGSHGMAELVKQLEASADIVLIDAPPLLPVTDAAVLAALTDGAILVVASGKTRRDQVKLAAASLSNVGARLLGVVLTMVSGRSGDANSYSYEYRYAGRAAAGSPRDVLPRGTRRLKGTQTPSPAKVGVSRDAGERAPDGVYRAAAHQAGSVGTEAAATPPRPAAGADPEELFVTQPGAGEERRGQ